LLLKALDALGVTNVQRFNSLLCFGNNEFIDCQSGQAELSGTRSVSDIKTRLRRRSGQVPSQTLRLAAQTDRPYQYQIVKR